MSGIPGATVRSIRPYKSSEQYLYAMKEDLAEWLKELYALDIEVGTFVEVLETGAVLCSHANNVTHVAGEFARACPDLARSLRLPTAGVTYNHAAQPGTFQARDNVSNFIQWCRKEMGIKEVLMFETDDLVLRKNEKNFVLCLLELARRASRFGMSAPTLIQMEEEIEEELCQELDLPPQEAPPPRPPRRPWDLQNLDQMVQCLVSRCTCPVQFAMLKMSEGKYRVGDSSTLIFVRILRSHVMVRVGGGWDTLEHYLDKHDPCRCTSLSHKQASKPGGAQRQVQHEVRLCPPAAGPGQPQPQPHGQPQPALVVSRSQSPLPPVAWGTYAPPGRQPRSPPALSPRRETRRGPAPGRPAPGRRDGPEEPSGRRRRRGGKSPPGPGAAAPPPASGRPGGRGAAPAARPRHGGLQPPAGPAPPPSPLRQDAPSPAPGWKSPREGSRGAGRSPSPLKPAGGTTRPRPARRPQTPPSGCSAAGPRGARPDPGPGGTDGPAGGSRAPRGCSAEPARGPALCRGLGAQGLGDTGVLGAAAEENHCPEGNRENLRPAGSARAPSPAGAAAGPRGYAGVVRELSRGRRPLRPVELSSWIAKPLPGAAPGLAALPGGGAAAAPEGPGAPGTAPGRCGGPAGEGAGPPAAPRPPPAKPRRCLRKPDRVPSIYKLKLRPKVRPRRDHRPGQRPSRIPTPLGRPAGGRRQPRAPAPAPPRHPPPAGRPTAKPPPPARARRLPEEEEEEEGEGEEEEEEAWV